MNDKQNTGPFFIDNDNSAHWYVVESKHRADWNKWLEFDEDDERSWDPPPFARRLNQSVSSVDFFLAMTPRFV